MGSLGLKIVCLVLLSVSMFHSVSSADIGLATMQTIATDVFYGGMAGALVATGVSLLQEDPDWQRNLRRGTGIGIILGLGFGIYDGLILSAPHYDRRGLINIEAGRIDWSVPQAMINPDGFPPAAVNGVDLCFDALRYRF